jgi:hypothetical protein
MNQKNKAKMIFCEPCSFKMILDSDDMPDNLVEIKTSPIPGGIPVFDAKSGKTKVKSNHKQNKKFKCPKCGRGVVIKELQAAYTNTIKQIDEKQEKEKLENDRKKRIEDGMPIEKNIDTEFLG